MMKSTLRFSVLASGSSGNSIYVETGDTRILIDAGISARETERRLARIGVVASDLDALIITHEHSDHIKGAGPLSRRYHLPVYLNRETLESGEQTLGKLLETVIIETGQSLAIKNLHVETFPKCHDAADPVGLLVSHNGAKMGVVTDLGRSTRLVENRLQQCRALILEFNHDMTMLDEGPYPLPLKQRIKSRDGHLSNAQAADLLDSVCHEYLKYLVLAHLSETNNDPDKAYQEAVDVLMRNGLSRTDIFVGRPHEPCPLIEVSEP